MNFDIWLEVVVIILDELFRYRGRGVALAFGTDDDGSSIVGFIILVDAVAHLDACVQNFGTPLNFLVEVGFLVRRHVDAKPPEVRGQLFDLSQALVVFVFLSIGQHRDALIDRSMSETYVGNTSVGGNFEGRKIVGFVGERGRFVH